MRRDIGLTAVGGWAYSRYPTTLLDRESLFWVMGLTHCILKWWVISEVSTRAVEDHRSGALELILCTPFSNRQLIRGQGQAVIRQFGKPTLVIALADFWFLYLGTMEGYGFSVNPSEWIWIWAGCFLMLPVDLWAITWFSMKSGLTAISANRAIFASVWRILIWPLLLAFVANVWLTGHFTGTPGLYSYRTTYTILFWQAAGIAISIASGMLARRDLPRLIARAAVGRYERTT